jgi:hypothetical protein
MPVQIVTAVELKDEGVIDLCHGPDLAVYAEEEEQE